MRRQHAMQPISLVRRCRLAWRVAVPLLLLAGLSACAVGGLSSTQVGSEQVTGSLPRPGESRQADARAADGSSEPIKSAAASQAPRRGTAKVALLLPLSGSGQTAVVAKAMKQAGELALFDRTATDLQLVVKDDKGTPDGARAAAEEAVREGAELILGPLLSASVQAAAPVAKAAGIPVIGFSNDRQAAGSGAYLLSFMAEPEVERVVGYAASQGRRNFAALLPDDGYGRLLEAAFTRAVAKAQANLITIERYPNSGTGMLEPTRRLAEAMSRGDGAEAGATDALFLPGSPETLASLGPLLAYVKLDTTRVKLLGSGGWDAPNIGRDQTFVGAWFPAPDPHGWQAFAEKFGKTFGSVPPRIASLVFDAVGIALTLAGEQRGPRFTTASLTRASGFTGADGQVNFLTDGTASRSLAILEVQSFGATTVDAAGAAQTGAAQSALPSNPVN